MHAPVIWVDESAVQIARIEADVTSDIAFGGGIIGKVYRGGHFVVEQAEVAPGIWLPTLYIYNVGGRKFLFWIRYARAHRGHSVPPSRPSRRSHCHRS